MPSERELIAETCRIAGSRGSELLLQDSIPQLRTSRVDQLTTLPDFGHLVGRMARDLAALLQISNAITSTRDLDLLQRRILELIFEVIPAENGAIVLRNQGDEGPHSVCSWSRHFETPQEIRIHEDIVRQAIWERGVVQCSAVSEFNDTESVLCLPLVAVERVIGVIYLSSPEAESPFCDDHVHFLTAATQIASVPLEYILSLDALKNHRPRLKPGGTTAQLLGTSPQVKAVMEFVRRVSDSDSTVLIMGESGTGKELVARAIHESGPRSHQPFVAINCAAIPEALLETELFGHEKGAFTGATSVKTGKFEDAKHGTIFLDEIGELAPILQAKLLRVLQQRQFERLGGHRSLEFNARVLAATNRNLEAAIKAGEFRQDLFYRLNVVAVTIPPLRERREDIPLLALHFADKYSGKSKRPFKGISRQARALLMQYSWPGNVRELESAMEHALIMGIAEEILPEDLPGSICAEQNTRLIGTQYREVIDQTRKDLILCAIREANGNFPEAARLLNIHPKYLHRLARKLNLQSDTRLVQFQSKKEQLG